MPTTASTSTRDGAVDHERRRLLGVAAMTVSGPWLGGRVANGLRGERGERNRSTQAFSTSATSKQTPGIGHTLPQEAPAAFMQAIMDVDPAKSTQSRRQQ